ncbi:MAG: Mpo1-like protein [Phycisphaerae bacterium]
MPRWLHNWFERHQHPASLILHLLGIPLTIVAAILAVVQLCHWRWDLWWRPAILLVVGYLLQWIGHRIEGNDMGEFILVKKRLGRPYVAVSPKYAGKAVRQLDL